MKLLPRSLFGRNLLLIVGLIVAGQIGNAIVFREFVLKPRVRQTADTTVRNLEALQAGLRSLPAVQRSEFVARFNAQAVAQPASTAGGASAAHEQPRNRLTLLERAFVRDVGARLAQRGGEAVWRRESSGSLAVKVNLDGDDYWLTIPGLLPGREASTGAWLVRSSAAMLLAALGAWLIQRRINRPLNQLVQAAHALGRGERPPALAEEGPTEIATLAYSFNEMVAALARNEGERMLMLAGLSHDLRTPLAKMRLATELLEGKGEAELLASLNRSIDGLDRLLAQFLDFARASHGGDWAQEALQESDLNQLAAEALALCQVPEADGAATLQFQPGNLPHLPLRPQAVRRLVLNLVVNAQRHGRPPIEVATGRDAQGIWLEVRDRGPGIATDRAAVLKRPFARGDEARSGPLGAGLGLAIIDRIAQAHGARFDLLPREGGGLVARVCWAVA